MSENCGDLCDSPCSTWTLLDAERQSTSTPTPENKSDEKEQIDLSTEPSTSSSVKCAELIISERSNCPSQSSEDDDYVLLSPINVDKKDEIVEEVHNEEESDISIEEVDLEKCNNTDEFYAKSQTETAILQDIMDYIKTFKDTREINKSLSNLEIIEDVGLGVPVGGGDAKNSSGHSEDNKEEIDKSEKETTKKTEEADGERIDFKQAKAFWEKFTD